MRNTIIKLRTIIIEPYVAAEVSLQEILVLLYSHACGEWGDVSDADCARNIKNLMLGTRLRSVFRDQSGHPVYITTNAGRTETRVSASPDSN